MLSSTPLLPSAAMIARHLPLILFLAASVPPAAVGAQGDPLAESFTLLRVLNLEEDEAHLVAAPRMVPDPRGGWLYWDTQGNDVRLYSKAGELRAAFGREGDGPGEFRQPVGVARLPDGRIVVADSRSRISVWTAGGDSLLSDFSVDVARPRGLVAHADNTVLVNSAPLPSDEPGRTAPMIHRVDLGRREVVESYFTLDLGATGFTAAASIESPPPLLRGDSIFLVVAPFDSLWSVSLSSGRSRSRPIESEAIASNPSTGTLSEGRSAFRAWVAEATFPGLFIPMPDGGWMLQTWGLRSDGPIRGLVRLDSMGRAIWELDRTSDLLAFDERAGEFLFWDPQGLDPSAVKVMRERARRDAR